MAASTAFPSRKTTSFDALFQEHRDGLLGFLYRRLWSREDAEDALMQTFYKAWRAREGFRGDATEKQWLYGIANRVSIDFIRSKRLTAETPYDEELGETEIAPDGDPVDAVLQSQRCSEIRGAIERLSPEQRRLVQLYYFDNRRFDEIGSALGIPSGQVRSRLQQVRRLMQRELMTGAAHYDAAY